MKVSDAFYRGLEAIVSQCLRHGAHRGLDVYLHPRAHAACDRSRLPAAVDGVYIGDQDSELSVSVYQVSRSSYAQEMGARTRNYELGDLVAFTVNVEEAGDDQGR